MFHIIPLRKLPLIFLLPVLLQTLPLRGQTILCTESFDAGSATTPPPGWAIEQVSGTAGQISFLTSGTHPTTAPYNGSRLVEFNSYTAASGSSTRLKRTAAISTVGYAVVNLDFAWYEDVGYPTANDRVEVQWSLNGTTWTTAGSFSRYDPGYGWEVKNLALPPGTQGQPTLYVAFLFTSDYGNNCHLDLMHVSGISLLPNCGMLTGVVRSCYNNALLAGALVTCGPYNAITNASGQFTILNIPAGNYTVNISVAGFLPGSYPVVIQNQQATTLNRCLDPEPGVVTGIVTNAESGAPIVGAKVQISSFLVSTYSVAGGQYTLNLYPCATTILVASKAGFDNWTGGPYIITCGDTIIANIAMQPSSNPVGPGTAGLNAGETAVDITWPLPSGPYEILYDDGIQDDFVVWAAAGNQHAVKFTPPAYPATLTFGTLNLGTMADYPGATLPLTPYQVLVYDDDGIPAGSPGTMIGVCDVTPVGTGWTSFWFAPITITSGSFYLAMTQGGVPPQACGIAIDHTAPQLRSYSRDVAGGGPWVPAAGNFMMRAVLNGPGGPLPPADQQGSGSQTGVGGDAYELGPDGGDNTESITGYRIYRLVQGQEGNQAAWSLLGTTTQLNFTDNAWPSLACNPYRWAIRAEYFNGSLSAPVFTNVLGKCWTADVEIRFTAPCHDCYKNGALVTLTNTVYPDTSYRAFTDTAGIVQFNDVWKGNYNISLLRFGCPVVNQNLTITADTVVLINITQGPTPFPARDLDVNSQSLLATWSPPRAVQVFFEESWVSGSFTTNQWTVTGGTNWQISAGFGNPAPSAAFNWAPQCTNCTQMLTSKPITGLNSPGMHLIYDVYLDNFNTTSLSTFAVELWNGTNWTVLRTFDNAYGDIPWTTDWLDISQVADTTFQFRFRITSEDTYSINNWNVDNIKVQAYQPDAPNCLLGYNVYLNSVLGAFTEDTTWAIPPQQVIYGQPYTLCVAAVYNGSYAPEICDTFTARFLYPPVSLEVVPLECAAHLTWQKPVDANGQTPAGLAGYRIFRNYDLVHVVGDPDSLEYYDLDLDPGNYVYGITARYDLTPYGFPGQFGESLMTGNIVVSIACGHPLPFGEDWSQGSFAFNGWEFEPGQGNWNISQVLKSNDPVADFSWQPIRSNYSYALVSPPIDASGWTCADIWFTFDYKLADRNATGNEKLAVEVWYDNAWHPKTEFVNNGSTEWIPVSFLINEVKDKGFKVRFIASGQNSSDILHWYVDNIHIYGTCFPPLDLYADAVNLSVYLSWEMPECGTMPQHLDYIFDDASAENGWAINPGYLAWMGNFFPIAATDEGVLQEFDVWFGFNPATSQQLTLDVFDGAHNLVGSSDPFTTPAETWLTVMVNDIPFSGPFYAMVKWDLPSTATNYMGYDEDGPYAGDDLEWYFDGTSWAHLSDPSVAGANPGVFLIRARALVGADLKSAEWTPGTRRLAADSSIVTGFNVYRSEPYGLPPFERRNSSPVQATNYTDNLDPTWLSYTRLYYVTALFENPETGELVCESATTDTVSIFVGMDDPSLPRLALFPNPAGSTVTIRCSEKPHAIVIENYLGAAVYSDPAPLSAAPAIDVSGLPAGLYLARVSFQGSTRVVKLVVAR